MTDENQKKDDEPETKNAVDDLKKGVGLLLRAAKTAAQGAAHRAKDAAHAEKVENVFKHGVEDIQKTIDRLQSDKLEGALKTSLQEIGRAFGNVAETLERELRGDDDVKKDEPPKDDEERDKKS
jgi:hypothetical protein